MNSDNERENKSNSETICFKKNKKIRVCIVTLDDLMNYGNRLQNLALQDYLENEWKVKCKTLWPNDITGIHSIFLSLGRSAKHALLAHIPSPLYQKYAHYRAFTKSNHFVKKDALLLFPLIGKKLANRKYDVFIAGSDQVWTSNHSEALGNTLLDFVSPKKRASYAASFGGGVVSESDEALISKEIKNFAFVSLREKEGAALIQKYFDKSVEINIDPVFLLSKERWTYWSETRITKGVLKWKNRKYLLLYWLGKDQEKGLALARKIAEEKKLEIAYIPLYSVEQKSILANASPFEFVFLVSHSSFVLTNSFHGTAFSIIFNRPFLSLPIKGDIAQKTDSRFANLQSTLELPIGCFDENESGNIDIDWGKVNDSILTERARSDAYFQKIFAGIK